MPAKLTWDPEQGFQYWYNAGHRRSWGEVAQRLGVHENTIRQRAYREDWKGRADDLDLKVREKTDRELAKKSAVVNAEIASIADAVLAKFARRLLPTNQDGSPNLAQLRPEDISVDDALKMAKLRLLVSGHATSRSGSVDPDDEPELEEIEAELARMSLTQLEAELEVREASRQRAAADEIEGELVALEPGDG